MMSNRKNTQNPRVRVRPTSTPGWAIPEHRVTDQAIYNRRKVLRAGVAGIATMAATTAMAATAIAAPTRWAEPHRPLSDKMLAQTYNNFYEFGSHKKISKAAQALKVAPWRVEIDGLVETPQTLAFEDIVRQMPIEERIYRLRCVEAWSAVIPWTGFPLAALVDVARPLAKARYLALQTFSVDDHPAPGFRQSWYPWPYVEGITMAEAMNPLAFIATGNYGQDLPAQNGAPLRLLLPWKYGFKSVKSLVRLTFTDKQPSTFWSKIQPGEYGFWANVNPAVPHPRWSQAQEQPLGSDQRIPTELYNGYAPHVADLYKGLDLPDEVLYR